MRIAAMLSMHAHAKWPHRRFPDGVEVMSLGNAVDCLKRDGDGFAASRRRRSIATLGAAGLENESFKQAVVELGGDPPEIEWVIKRSKAGETSSLFPFPRSAHAQTGGPAEKAKTESLVADLYDEYSPAGCKWKKQYSLVQSEPEVSLSVSIEVDRGWRDVARSIDPQSWDQCSKFFVPPERTYLVAGSPATDFNHVDTSVAAGAEYPWRTLFEHFSCKACPSEFQTLLRVKSQITTDNTGSTEQTFTYQLERPVMSAVGKKASPAVLKTDGGKLWVKRQPSGKTTAGVSKTVEFEPPNITTATAVALQMTEQAGEFAEMVCCLVGSGGP